MVKIKDIVSREVLDSRGNPTVETDVYLDDGSFGRAIVPSGASTGKKEALELRDGDKSRYLGNGVLQAVNNVNTILKSLLVGQEASQELIDNLMINEDGTKNKSRLGANAILSVSLALFHALSDSEDVPLYKLWHQDDYFYMPVPMMNIINGGKHASNAVDFQEYMIVPVGADSFKNAVRMGSEIFHTLKSLLIRDNLSTGVGDEGGFSPDFKDNQAPLDYINEAILKAGYKPGEDVCIALDVASSEFYLEDEQVYDLHKSNNGKKTSSEMIDYLEWLVDNYPIISIEDGLSEDDIEGWKELTLRLGDRIQLVGDDLFVTNYELLEEGIKNKTANAILIKVNQIGTIMETFKTINLAKENNYRIIISHRSGESEDTTIADLAVLCSSLQIKTGSLSRSERIAKYNRLIRIEEEQNDYVIYPGYKAFGE